MVKIILGITPARGGSKEVPRKNIKKCAGKPLIEWTIESALKSKLLDRYIVSTDDKEIADISEQAGAEILQRPEELAKDDTPTLPDVIQHALQQIPADIVVILQATSPIRNDDLIDYSIQKFLRQKADSLASGFICKYKPYGTYTELRQDINGFFYDDGNIYIIKSDLIKKGDRYGKNMAKVFTDKEENIEIDTEFDFWIAEKILEKRMG